MNQIGIEFCDVKMLITFDVEHSDPDTGWSVDEFVPTDAEAGGINLSGLISAIPDGWDRIADLVTSAMERNLRNDCDDPERDL